MIANPVRTFGHTVLLNRTFAHPDRRAEQTGYHLVRIAEIAVEKKNVHNQRSRRLLL